MAETTEEQPQQETETATKTDEAGEEPKKDVNAASGSSDGFIGSRRIRTFLIGGLLIAWGILGGIGFFSAVKGNGFYGFINVVTGIAAFVLVGGCAAAIVLHCMNKEGGVETIVGYIVLISGIVICVAQIIGSFASGAEGIFFFLIIGEGILPGGTAIFLGLDIVKDFMSKEDRRLFCNLALLATTACMCMMAYYDTGRRASKGCKTLRSIGFPTKGVNCGGGFNAVGTGYLIIAAVSITYCVLNFCSCITCGCHKNPMIRLLIAGLLIVGGLVTAIGYWSITAGQVSLALGLSILVGGLCVTWALDMGIVDDVKGMKK